MTKQTLEGISFFEKNLTVWVVLCMVAGVLIGKFLPVIPETLSKFEYAKVSIPIAVLIWLMIYPMMMKVDFASIRNVGRNPAGLYVTWIANWLIKPFSMFGIAALFFYVIFSAFIPPELAKDYLAGAVILGAAPCTAMVFVWSHLTRGNPAYTVVQVATNDLIILVAFTPIVALLLGIGLAAPPLRDQKPWPGLFSPSLSSEVQQHHHWRSAPHPGADLLLSGRGYPGESAAHRSDCCSADHPDGPDLFSCLCRVHEMQSLS